MSWVLPLLAAACVCAVIAVIAVHGLLREVKRALSDYPEDPSDPDGR